MTAFPISRFFRLSEEGVRCDERGMFVAGAPMLTSSPTANGGRIWAARQAEEQNRDLEACYGFPIDVAAKRDGLTKVAQALHQGDVALAQVRALLLRFPDPPSLTKDAERLGSAELARELQESGLLKADWDPAKHPRVGEPPNAGWFAPKDGEQSKPATSEAGPPPEGFAPAVGQGPPAARNEEAAEPAPNAEANSTSPFGDGSPSDVMQNLRALLKAEVLPLIEAGLAANWLDSKIQGLIDDAVANLNDILFLSPQNMALMALRARADAQASKDPPKTLTELQTPPTENASGYDHHHLVQQNPSNLAKSPEDVRVDKFGQNALDAPSNLVWIPRSKHQLITDYYNSIDPNDPLRRLRRQVVAEMDFDSQLEDALATLRMFGVLQ